MSKNKPLSENANFKLLSKFGLKEIMYTDPNSKHYFDEQFLLDDNTFERYRSKEYLNSDLIDTDEVYSFRNTILFHKVSGVRFEYAISEDYLENAEYKLLSIFIKNKKAQQLEVVDFDFTTGTVLTRTSKVKFNDIKLDIDGD